jgi:trigger factor
MKPFKINKIDHLNNGEIVIEGELTVEAINAEKPKAISSFQDRISLDGFRKGHIPEKILIEKVGELSVYEEAASVILEKSYGDIIKEAHIMPIGSPRVSITKIALGNPVGFKIETAIMPEVKLGDYKKLAKEEVLKKEDAVVGDIDVEQALDNMRRSLAHHEKHHSEENKSDHVQPHDDHSGKDIPEEELPALDDEFAKKVGSFTSIEVLKEKIKESILNERKVKAQEKNRLQIIERIIEASDIAVPNILIESELQKMIAEFRSNVERMGIKFEDYIKHINKNEDDLKSEWKDEAEKRSKIQLILNKIAEAEKIEEDEEIVKKEIEEILKQYKDTNPVNVENYVRTMLLNEKVWQFLENNTSTEV